jgi:hypothetical protein
MESTKVGRGVQGCRRGPAGNIEHTGVKVSTAEYGDQQFVRRCETIINTLPIHHPFELRAFLDAVGQQRGMTVVLGRIPTRRGGASGLLARSREECWLMVAAKATPAHRTHIAFHEVGHWVLGHPGDHLCTRRTHLDDRWEAEAEQFAHLLRAHVRAGAARHRARLPPGHTALRAAFGARRHLCTDG